MANPKFKVGDKVLVINLFLEHYNKIFNIDRTRQSSALKDKTVYVGIINGEEVHFDEDDLDFAHSGTDIKNAIEVDYSKGSKYDNGKAPIHMIPEEAILGMAQAFGYGAKKYDRFNYRKGIEFTRLMDSLMRHLLAFSQGQDNDDESGLPHTYHILANAAMLEFSRLYHPDLDDRFDYNGLKNAKKK